MHEMGIAMSIVAEVERCLDDYGPEARGRSVTVEVGRLRAVVPDALSFCFEAASKGTRVEGATLIIREIPVVVRCAACDREWTADELAFFCPACDGAVSVLAGKELTLRTIEIEHEE